MAGYFESIVDKIIENVYEVSNEISKRIVIRIIEEVKDGVHEIISEYYDDYTPESYHRRGYLYDAFKIDFDGSEFINASLNADNMPLHGAKSPNDIIYHNAFIDGYHGGSVSQETHGLHLWKDNRSNFHTYLFYHDNYINGEAPKYAPKHGSNMENEISDYVNKYSYSSALSSVIAEVIKEFA